MDILINNDNYQKWRDEKLKNYQNLDSCWVEISGPKKLSSNEISKIKELTKTNNFALIKIQNPSEENNLAINSQLGLIDNEKHFLLHKGLANITPKDKKDGEFIPYTTKKLNWHTDGYYNSYANRIRSFTLLCVNPAISGGDSHWMDIEILYILMREKNPELTKLLTVGNAMSIPAHITDGKIMREISTDAIFLIDKLTNSLYMRYTQRKKNINFAPETISAIKLLDEILTTKTKYHHKYLLKSGEGIINNNVIHNRETFVNNEKNPRLMLRGRYFTRI